MRIFYSFGALIGVIILSLFSCKQNEEGPLKEFKGRVLKVTPQVLQVVDATGTTIMFDNRNVTYVSGMLMKNDSVSVSYRGKLDNGTESVIAELIQDLKNDK